ncbi:MAG TPA: DUF3455 domain-containing protein [Urbifossiella sp.]|nr:DUF3455 domain-containing protein [Urbifossiella sp.]
MTTATGRGVVLLAAVGLLLLGAGGSTARDGRSPDLDDYDVLRPPAGSRVAFEAYAEGVQVYQWTGTTWTFVGPEAVLYDLDGDVVGIHYAGPTWETVSGSTVVGAVVSRATPDPTAIPWLLLRAVSADGPGVLRRATHVQRLYTTGGLVPAAPGGVPGEMARVPYTAYYFFYRTQ